MPDLPNRDDLETDLARDISRRMQRQLNDAIAVLGDPPDLNNLTPDFWQRIESELSEVIRPQIEGVFLQGAEQLLNSQPLAVDWGLINQRAADWSGQYAFNMVGGLTETTRNLLQKKVSLFFEESGRTIGDLKRDLQQAFGPVRAQMIAVTETTRAAVEGQNQFAEEINNELGVQMVPFWQTNRDDLVCPICGPKDGLPIEDGEYPPAHPRCRCWVNHEIPN